MLTFKDLKIHADDMLIKKLVEIIADKMKKDDVWLREQDRAVNLPNINKVYHFRKNKKTDLPEAFLELFPKEENVWYVPNVVPLKSGQLSHKEYNGIITEFFVKYLKEAAEKLEIRTELTSGEIEAKDFLGDNAAELLSSFSSLANKSTGSSHPCDKERWFKFIDQAYKFNPRIDTELLRRLLVLQGWDDESSIDLVIEFEQITDFLEHQKGK